MWFALLWIRAGGTMEQAIFRRAEDEGARR